MKSVKTTVALALMLLLSTGMIACKKAEEAEVAAPAVEQAAPAVEPAAPVVEPAPADAAPAEAPAAK